MLRGSCIVLLAVASGGCDHVLGLAPRPFVPDAVVPSGFDEDRDEIDDALDNCPGITNPDQSLDADGDRVGDPCDPHPDVAGDVLLAAYYFNDPASDPAAWQPQTAWQFEQGSIVQASSGINANLIALEGHLLTSSLSLELGYRPFRLGGSGNEAGLAIDGFANRCYVEEDTPGDNTSQLWLAPSARTRIGKDIVPPLAVGAFARMRLTRDTTAGLATLRCRVGSAELEAIDVPDMRGELAITSGLQPMRVEYLLIYGLAP